MLYVEMKKFGTLGGVRRARPLDPPMEMETTNAHTTPKHLVQIQSRHVCCGPMT